MVKYVFLVIITLAIASSGAGYYATTLWRSTLIAQDQQTGLSAKLRLIESAVFFNGEPALPFGINIEQGHALPLNFTGVRTTASGKLIQYCPYGKERSFTPNTEIKLSNTLSYEVETASLEGANYVISSSAAPAPGIIAVLILPNSSGRDALCSDVGIDELGRFMLTGNSAGGGRVITVHASEVPKKHDKQAYSLRMGDSVGDIFDEINNKGLQDVTIFLESGAMYPLDGNWDIQAPKQTGKGRIRIQSNALADPAVLAGNTNTTLRFENYDVEIEGVLMLGSIELNLKKGSHTLTTAAIEKLILTDTVTHLKDVSLGSNTSSQNGAEFINSSIYQTGHTWIRSNGALGLGLSNSTWRTDSGSITIRLTAASSIGIQLQNSEMSLPLNVNSETNQAQAMLYVDSTSKLLVRDVNWTHSGSMTYWLYAEGETLLHNANINLPATQVGILSYSGAKIHSTNSLVGSASSPLTIGWLDSGLLRASGAITFNSATCTSGGAFERPASYTYTDTTVENDGAGGLTPVTIDRLLALPFNEIVAPISITCN